MINLLSATITNPALRSDLGTKSGAELFAYYLGSFWKAIIILGALFFLVFFLWGGMMWITSGSDAQGLKQAKERVINAALGLGILVASYAIMQYLLPILGLDIFCIDWQTLQTGVCP